jgi:hypothetical protein
MGKVHRHSVTQEHPHTGKQTFASPKACEVYRQATRLLWNRGGGGADLPPLPAGGLRIAVVNRPTGDRNISNAGDVADAIQRAFPSSLIDLKVRERETFASQLRIYGESDVVISAHGGSMANTPMMKEGSLLIEVDRHPPKL